MAKSKTVTAKDKDIREYRAFSNGNNATAPAIEEDDFNPEKEMDKKFKSIQKRARLIQKFKEMKPYLPRDEVLQYERELGLVKEDETGNEQGGMDDMPLIMDVIRSEKDPHTRRMMIMSLLGKKGGNSDIAAFAMMMPQQNQPNESSFEKEILRKIVEERFTKQESPTNSLKEAMEIIQTAQQITGGGGNPMEELKQNLKDYKEIGLLGDKGNSIEEKKIQFEKEKFEYEKDMEFKKSEMEADKQKNLINLASKSLVKIVPKLVAGNRKYEDEDDDEEEEEPEPPKRQPEPQPRPQPQQTDAIRYRCNNEECQREFLITHLDKPRMLICPNLPQRKCDHVYELTADSAIKVYRLTGEDLEETIKKYGGKPQGEEDGQEET